MNIKRMCISLLTLGGILVGTIMINHVSSKQLPKDEPVAAETYDIALTDQATAQILVLGAEESDWNRDGAVKWSWQPKAGNGFGDLTKAWGLPSGLKLRNSREFGGQWMVLTDSRGLAAIVPYPSGDFKKWGRNVGGNPHAAELLPNGNLAVAASTGGWVRVYASSQGPNAEHYVEYKMPGAHGVLWDPKQEVLWAVGDHFLVKLKVKGTAKQPLLEETFKRNLPTVYGHDLQPVYGNTDRLWVTTNTGVYQYVKSTDSWDTQFAGSSEISRSGVKAVGNQLSGQVVLTRPKAGCQYEWCTDTVEFFAPNVKVTRAHASIYKARILNPEYQ